jgi:hypothetical protein
MSESQGYERAAPEWLAERRVEIAAIAAAQDARQAEQHFALLVEAQYSAVLALAPGRCCEQPGSVPLAGQH